MMGILIRNADRKREKLLTDIATLEQEIINLDLPEATEKNYGILREILHKHQLYIKDKKQKKLIREENDYRNGRIYTFARKFDQGKNDSNPRISDTHPINISAPNSLTDVSSISTNDMDPATNSASGNMHTHRDAKPSPFLEELARYRIGILQNYKKTNPNTKQQGGEEKSSDSVRREGMTTRSNTKNLRT
ncbi:hypothetical protein NDU88_002064 [Pleurodeles waltl]|uniref:Uncharacterized protein n=1 Tax=Pleurodeles waltl TaxID=8319 RepID=A0AAV7VYM6_PLEWA|nr:hypothetical protein NDU88_002064 [Pleurodeles waltl]